MATLKAILNNADEASVPCTVILEHPEYIALELADAAQLALCTPDSVVLTDDGPLYRTVSARGSAALSFRDEKCRRRRFLI